MIDDTNQRLMRLEARAEIRELITLYGIAVDDRDMDLLKSLFTDDVHLILSRAQNIEANGIDEVMNVYDKLLRKRGATYHWTHDVIIRVEDDDGASGLVLAHAETSPDGTALIVGLRYKDRYRFVDDRWKFAERRLQYLYSMPPHSYAERFPTDKRVYANDSWQTADIPETLECWSEFFSRKMD